MEASRGILEDIRVVDLSRGVAGATAALLLAELGADVIKVQLTHEADSGLRPELAALRDRSKARETVDLHTEAGRTRLHELARLADVIMHDRTPAEMEASGLDRASLCRGRSDVVFATIGAWPASHPLRNREVDDTLVLAEAGLMDEQEPVARDGPAYLAFPLGSLHAAWLCAIGVVVRLIRRKHAGTGGNVGTSLVQGAMLPMMLYWSRAQKPTPSLSAGMPKQTQQPLYQCADGQWMHVMGNPAKAPAVAELLRGMNADTIRDANDRHSGNRPRVYPNLGTFAQIFRSRPRAYWLEALWTADVPVQPVLDVGELFQDEQARASGYVEKEACGDSGPAWQAAVPLTIHPPACMRKRSPSPWLTRDPPIPSDCECPGNLPLAGLKVVDFGSYLAGPLAPMLLADLGADVIKVEAVRGEPLRAAEWAFNACQRGKRAIALDLSHPAAAKIVERLVQQADVVHHNQRMPAARKLGIDDASLRRMNPDLIIAHVSAYGPQGPRKDWPGYDQLFQAASGWEKLAAGEGNPPTWLRFGMMDHLAALASLLGTVAALYHRQKTGEGQSLASSLLGASLFSLDTALFEDGRLLRYPKLDAQQMGVSSVNRLYRCQDGWIAVSASDSGSEGRLLRASRCDSIAQLETLCAQATVREMLSVVSDAGIPCVQVVTSNRDGFFDSPENRNAGLLAAYPHPVYGMYEQIGAFWDFDDLELSLERAPPVLGQDSLEILEELGFSVEEIAVLQEQGVIAAASGQTP